MAVAFLAKKSLKKDKYRWSVFQQQYKPDELLFNPLILSAAEEQLSDLIFVFKTI